MDTPTLEPPIMTGKEIARYLRMDYSTFLVKANRCLLPVVKIGMQWRGTRRQIDQWLEEQAQRRVAWGWAATRGPR